MISDISVDAENRMKKCTENLKGDLMKVRTGRAHPSLIESVPVLYYGNPTPLSQVANIVVEDARTLSITPWDKNMVQAIDKAIRISDMGLNPTTAGSIIRINLPPLTEERRRDLVKQVRNQSEEAKISIRNVRREANQQVKDLLKNKKITEDDNRRSEEAIQKLTDRFISDIDKIAQNKESELMSI